MFEAKLEFPEGWRGHRANPFRGGYGYFLEPHNRCSARAFLADWEKELFVLLGDVFGLLGKYSFLERAGMARVYIDSYDDILSFSHARCYPVGPSILPPPPPFPLPLLWSGKLRPTATPSITFCHGVYLACVLPGWKIISPGSAEQQFSQQLKISIYLLFTL